MLTDREPIAPRQAVEITSEKGREWQVPRKGRPEPESGWLERGRRWGPDGAVIVMVAKEADGGIYNKEVELTRLEEIERASQELDLGREAVEDTLPAPWQRGIEEPENSLWVPEPELVDKVVQPEDSEPPEEASSAPESLDDPFQEEVPNLLMELPIEVKESLETPAESIRISHELVEDSSETSSDELLEPQTEVSSTLEQTEGQYKQARVKATESLPSARVNLLSVKERLDNRSRLFGELEGDLDTARRAVRLLEDEQYQESFAYHKSQLKEAIDTIDRSLSAIRLQYSEDEETVNRTGRNLEELGQGIKHAEAALEQYKESQSRDAVENTDKTHETAIDTSRRQKESAEGAEAIEKLKMTSTQLDNHLDKLRAGFSSDIFRTDLRHVYSALDIFERSVWHGHPLMDSLTDIGQALNVLQQRAHDMTSEHKANVEKLEQMLQTISSY